ncbi:prephenate dehydratase [Corallococcus sp. H22C18031201]|nr:prephenate dehydratase [Corallococcus sp. H22C18031201]
MADAPPRIAFQGEPGAFGEEATRALFGADVDALPHPTFRAVFEAVTQGRVDGGVVPVENAIAGPVVDNLDLLIEFQPPLSGEWVLRVRHCLLAPPGRALADIERVLSHPQALAQCAGYLRGKGLHPVPESNTAAAAKRVAEELPPRTAAIASLAAARRYGLTVLDEGIEDSADNATRFLALGRARPPNVGTRRKTTVCVSVADTAQGLSEVLAAFASRNLTVTGLFPRPGGGAWRPVWLMDVEAAEDSPRLLAALEDARAASTTLRVLGGYATG